MKLNLQATTKEERKVKAYLEANASEMLAEKINNGVRIQKDGKMLFNRKTLASFMKFACDEAKKQAEKGASSACIDDSVVYGWAVHYFEEDSIEGTLYNEDGTEYKAPVPKVTAKAPAVKSVPPKPQPKPQMSMFDLLDAKSEELAAEEPGDEPTDEDDTEAAEALAEKETAKPPERTVSPMYQNIWTYRKNTRKPSSPCAWATSMKYSARTRKCLQTNCILPLRAGIADLKAACRWLAFRTTLRMCISAKS